MAKEVVPGAENEPIEAKCPTMACGWLSKIWPLLGHHLGLKRGKVWGTNNWLLSLLLSQLHDDQLCLGAL